MQPMIYLVDDEAVIRDALGWLFRSCELPLRPFALGQEFLTYIETGEDGKNGAWNPQQPACLIIDVRMPDMTGLELFEALTKRQIVPTLPVIFLTGHGDVPMAVDMLKKGAFDFVEKPFNDNALVERVRQALNFADTQLKAQAGQAQIHARLRSLSPRETEVMEHILLGSMNKVIADALGISMRTVEVHRARIFAKMSVKSAVELAQLLNRNAQEMRED